VAYLKEMIERGFRGCNSSQLKSASYWAKEEEYSSIATKESHALGDI